MSHMVKPAEVFSKGENHFFHGLQNGWGELISAPTCRTQLRPADARNSGKEVELDERVRLPLGLRSPAHEQPS